MRAPHHCTPLPIQSSSTAAPAAGKLATPIVATASDLASAPDDGTLAELLTRHGLRIFYGDLHNHTSYSDGRGAPAAALAQMQARGLDFAALTDHGENLTPTTTLDKWQALAAAVAQVNHEPHFLAWRGFEWSPDTQGHINVWSSREYTSWQQTGDQGMESFYRWLAAAEAAPGRRLLAGFNHPLVE